VVKYFVADSEGEPLYSMDSETRQKEPSYYMGYQLLLANNIENSPNYDAKKVKQQTSQVAKKEKAAKVTRTLAKEGLDDVEPVKLRRGKRGGRKDPEKILNKNIRVKWYVRKDGDTEPLTAVAERRRGKKGTLFTGKAVSYNEVKKRYKVKFEDGDFPLNFTDKSRDDFIPARNWQIS
jgi:hypothetical protein